MPPVLYHTRCWVPQQIRSGDVIAIKHKEHNTVQLYPRGAHFLTSLSGLVRVQPGVKLAQTSEQLALELKRGEAVKLGDCWVRVSCEVCVTAFICKNAWLNDS